jgi:hypothetical protein
MKVEVFDDWKSIMHSIAGGLSYFFPLSLSYSYSMKLQSSSSYEKVKNALSATLWSSLQVTHSSDYFISSSGW